MPHPAPARGRRILLDTAALTLGHFLLATLFAFLTCGLDLDQLRPRSALSRASGVVHDVLWYPHDSVIRALPNRTLIRPRVIPTVLVGSSIFWGGAGAAVLELYRQRRDGMATIPRDRLA